MSEPVSAVTNNLLLFHTTHSSIEEGDLRLFRMQGVQHLSMLYEFVLDVQCSVEGGLAPDLVKELFRKPCAIGFGTNAMYSVAGILRQIEMFPVSALGGVVYRMVLVPRFWRTTQVRKSRVFNEMSVPDIIKDILTKDYRWSEGRDFEVRLSGSYTPREYIVQYEETDFAFISRWLEHYGIFYTFEQTDDGDKLVFLDRNGDTVAVPGHDTMRYDAREGIADHVGFVYGLSRVNRNHPAKVHLRDYNWRGPNAVYGDADIDTTNGYGIQVHYGEHFASDAAGAQLAQVRAQEWQTFAETFRGATCTGEMAPGCHFTLENAPIGDLDAKYLVTRVIHEAQQDPASGGRGGTYSNNFEAISYDVQYRPPRITPRPRIVGVMHAHVDGAGGTAAPIDEHGRYRVQLPFDVKPGESGRATRWIRMAQASAGDGYGIHFPLYPGTEILLAHVGGDPDRPLIVGAVPNASTPTYVGSARATRAAIRTISGVVIDIENDA